MTPVGIEPVTFRFVTQHLNHCATAVPRIKDVKVRNHYTGLDTLLAFQEFQATKIGINWKW